MKSTFKKILVICHFGLNENTPRSFRSKELIRALSERGYPVDIIIGKDKRLFHNGENVEDSITGERNNQSKNTYKVFRKIGSSILNYIYGDMVILKYYKSNKRIIDATAYDILISIGQPFYPHMISAFSKTNSNCIKIADCGDPFYVKGRGMAPHIGLLQKIVFKKLDYICVPTEKAVQYYTEFAAKEKIKVIPQGVDFKRFRISVYTKNTVPTFGYAGVFYEDLRDPRPFLEYLSDLKQDYCFHLYTDIRNDFFVNKIDPIIRKSGKRIVVHDLIPREECLYELSKMDFLVSFENKSSTQSPSKLIDYGITKRPVLSFEANSFQASVFSEFLSGNYSHKLNYDISKFDINNVTDQFEELFGGRPK